MKSYNHSAIEKKWSSSVRSNELRTDKQKKYDHIRIERRWQRVWSKESYKTPDVKKGAENFYLLTEFPYPSGNLHVGHWYAFAVPDILARHLRMKGKNVLYPIGFDAFGLPAENAALKRGLNPRKWTEGNITYMRKQLRSMGASFDWSREVVTCAPEYYRWTQWLFLQLYKRGLVYRKKTPVNWCPKDKTVLANEQVKDGKCERCDTEVLQKQMEQWNIKITDYAERLLKDLEGVDFPEEIKAAQRNWIGKSEGAEIEFQIKSNPSLTLPEGEDLGGVVLEKIKVFTTRPDTLFGVSFIALSPSHSLAKDAKNLRAVNPANNEEVPIFVADYVMEDYGTGAVMGVPAHDERDFAFAKKNGLPIKEVVIPYRYYKPNPPQEGKKSVARRNVHAIVINKKTGKVLGLRWRKFPWTTFPMGGVDEGEDIVEAARREVREETGYKNLKVVKVLGGQVKAEYFAAHKDENRVSFTSAVLFELQDDTRETISEEEQAKHEVMWMEKKDITSTIMTHAELDVWLERWDKEVGAYTGEGVLINSGKYNGMQDKEAKKKITESVEGKMTTSYKLRDWVVSRQRYWGVPIPLIKCPSCAKASEGKENSGWIPVPEKKLPVKLPDIKDYVSTGDGKSPLAKARKWVEVKCPQCGGKAERETDTLDTFVDSSWYFLRYTDPRNKKEFAARAKMNTWLPVDFYSGGAEHTTMHLLYSRFWHKVLFDAGLVADKEPYRKRMNRGFILGPDGQKMSKSRGNVVDPDAEVKQVGADTVRMYLAFIGPYGETGSYPWDKGGIAGIRRFLERVWRLQNKLKKHSAKHHFQKSSETLVPSQYGTSSRHFENDVSLRALMHKTIKKVGEDIVALKFNTAISALMVLTNALEKEVTLVREDFGVLLTLLAPFAPHLAEELWSANKFKGSVHTQPWPAYDDAKTREETVTIVVQINGKVRGNFQTARGTNETDAFSQAEKLSAIVVWLSGKTISKRFFVKDRLVNFVTA